MPMNKNNYWAERARKDKIKVINTGEKGIDNLKRLLLLNLKDVEKKITDFYEKYGENPAEKMTYSEWEKYKAKLSKMAKKNPQDKTLQKLAKQNIPKYRIDRLRALELDLQMQLTEATLGQEKGIYKTLDDVSKVSQATLASRMDKTLGLTFNTIASNKMKQILMSDWSGANWSDRLWKDREKVGEKLTNILEKGLPQGTSLQKMARELRDVTGNSFNNAFRLIRTETSFIDSQVTLEGYRQASEELGLEYYEYDAFLDSRTSNICRELDKKRFKVSEAEVGVNYPPMHPNCRSTTLLVLDEDYENDINVLSKDNDNILKSEKSPFDYKKFDGEIVDMLQDIANSKDVEVQEIFKYADKLPDVKISKGQGLGGFHPIGYTINTPDAKTLTHEIGHWLDYGLTKKKDDSWLPFSYNTKEELKNLTYKNADKLPLGVLNKLKQVQQLVSADGVPLFNEQRKWNEVSDIYDALTKGDLYSRGLAPFGHGRDYYTKASNQTTEIFAQYFSLRTYNKKEQLEFLSKYSPELVIYLDKQFTNYVKEIKNL